MAITVQSRFDRDGVEAEEKGQIEGLHLIESSDTGAMNAIKNSQLVSVLSILQPQTPFRSNPSFRTPSPGTNTLDKL